MFKLLFGESFVEFLVILTFVFFTYSSMADDQGFQGQANQRRDFKIRVISSELWYQGVNLGAKKVNRDTKNRSKIIVPEELEISLRRLK